MQEKITKVIDKHEKLRKVCNGCEVVGHLAHMLVPAAFSAYLLYFYNDIVVMVVGAMLGLYAFWQLVKITHAAVVNKPAKDKK